MTQIVGTLKDSGGNLLNGTLTVTLDSAIVDTATTPDTIYTLDPAVFTIVNGAINIALPQSQLQNATYHFVFAFTTTTTVYYRQDGTLYIGPNHVWTDSNYYTGTVHTSDSKVLSQVSQANSTEVLNFHAIVPNVATVDFSQLLPTGIGSSVLDTSIATLANLLTTNAIYAQALRGGPTPRGVWSSTSFYQSGDCVSYGGSSWLYVAASPSSNQAPTTSNTAYWQQIAAKGDAGGTGGQDTAYDPTGWDGATFAPTANAIRDVIVTLATSSQLANYLLKNNGVLDGTPTRSSSPIAGDRSSQLAITSWVGNEFAPINNPVLTGNPAVPLQSTSDTSNRIASTQWVNNFYALKPFSNTPFFQLTKTTSQTLSNGANAIVFNNTIADSDTATNASTATFTVPTGKGGWYEFIASCYVERTSGTTWDAFLELVFGSTVYRLQSQQTVNQFATVLSGSVQLNLAAGQSVSLRVSVNTAAAALAINAYANLVMVTFSGKRLLI